MDKDKERIIKILFQGYRENLFGADQLAQEVQALIDQAVNDAAKLVRGIKNPATFDFAHHPTIRRQLDAIIDKLTKHLTAKIEQGSKDAWLRANATHSTAISQMCASNTQLNDLTQQELNRPQNDRALEAWLKRKVAGLGLSDRVWNLTSQTKAQIEHSIEVALAKGTPAQKLSQEVRSCLKNPSNFFRRFQYKAGKQPLYDEHGQPMLDSSGKQMTRPIYDKKWKMRYVDDEGNYRWRDVDLNDYRYGRGVYRSSYMNAMRLARTEVNMAYHASDTERWSSAWYVKGIRISLSNNHTTLDPDGKKIPLHDICDDLAGDYPPDFDFKGWHPQCRCFAYAITATREEVKEYYRRKRAGEDMTNYRLPGTITQPPAAFTQWLSDNQDRLAKAAARGTTPYFVKDNLSYIGDTPVPALPAPQNEMPDPTPPTPTPPEQSPQKSIAELAAERHAARTPEDIDRIQSEWNQRNIQRAAEERHAARTTEEINQIQARWNERRYLNAYDQYYHGDGWKKTDEAALERLRLLRFSPEWDSNPAMASRQLSSLERQLKRTPDEIRAIQDRWDLRIHGKEYVENMHELEMALGIQRGKCMTIEQADKQASNPKWEPEFITRKGKLVPNPKYKEEYHINCQTCSPAYELRLRGFDITAGGNTPGSLSEYLSYGRSFEAWTNKDGTPCTGTLTETWMKSKGYTEMSKARYKAYIKETCKEPGTYVMTIGWESGGGHATIIQKTPDGKLFNVEPQVYNRTARRKIDELANDGAKKPTSKRGILRIDDKLFNVKYASIFRTK